MEPNSNPKANWLTRKEAAEYLGVAESTLANWACTKKFHLPYYRVGRSVRYRTSDLDAFVLSGEVI